ncbi:MAG: hypothetical protein MMC33_007560 [Icmadophila ericetorum]|nr:hypothetical protein [Icmadophila ericetorum]
MVWDLFRIRMELPRVVPERQHRRHGRRASSLCPEIFVERVLSKPRADGSRKQSLRWVVKKSTDGSEIIEESEKEELDETTAKLPGNKEEVAGNALATEITQQHSNTPPPPPSHSAFGLPAVPYIMNNLYTYPYFMPYPYPYPHHTLVPPPYGLPPSSGASPSHSTAIQQVTHPSLPITSAGEASSHPPPPPPPQQQSIDFHPQQPPPNFTEAPLSLPVPRRRVRYVTPFDTTLAPRMPLRSVSQLPQTPPSSPTAQSPEPEPSSSVEQETGSKEEASKDTPTESESGKQKGDSKGKGKGKDKQPKSILKKQKNVNFETEKETNKKSKVPPPPSVEDGYDSDRSDESDITVLSESEETYIDLFPPEEIRILSSEYFSSSPSDSDDAPAENPHQYKGKGKGKSKGKGNWKNKN